MSVLRSTKAYIAVCGRSWAEVARIADIPYPVFCEMMQGKQPVYCGDLQAICYALHIKPARLMGKNVDKNQEK